MKNFRIPNFRVTTSRRRSLFTETLPTLPVLIQTAITSFQSCTDLPWWATIACSTTIVRLGLLPLVRRQIIESHKLSTMPETKELTQLLLLKNKSIPNSDVKGKLNALKSYLKGLNAASTFNGVNKYVIFLYPVANAAAFITFVYSIRSFIVLSSETGSPNLTSGGLFWFTDLSAVDSTVALPIMATSLTLLGLEISFSRSQSKFFKTIKELFQGLTILSFGFIMQLPAGVFCYWIPNSCLTILQSLSLKNREMCRLLKIPYIAPPSPSPSQPSTIETVASTDSATLERKDDESKTKQQPKI